MIRSAWLAALPSLALTPLSVAFETFALVLVTLSGCTPARPSGEMTRSDSLRTRVATLEKDTQRLRERIFKLELAGSLYDEVTIDPSTKSFQRLDTTVGTLLVSCQDIRQYANGYKVLLDVGNTTMATLNGFKIKVSWGPSFTDTTVTDWETARQDKTFEVTDRLVPGKWNRVSFVLAPAQPRDLGYVTVAIETGVVSLLQ